MIEFINSSMIDQALAWLLTIIILNGLYKLTKGVKARLTSWGMWLIVAYGTVLVRFPQSYGFYGLVPWLPLIRFVTYIIVIAMAIEDWRRYFQIKKQRAKEKERGGFKS